MPEHSQKGRILVIDDDPELRAMISSTLEGAGYEVTTAASGPEGFRIQSSSPADLVILDMLMPEKDGVEMTVQIRRSFPKLPILAVSGAATQETLLRAAERLGASNSLRKPFHPDDLLRSVEETLRFK